MRSRRITRHIALSLALLASAGTAPVVLAQQKGDAISDSALLKRIEGKLAQGGFVEARGDIKQLITRLQKDVKQAHIVAKLHFLLGRGYVEELDATTDEGQRKNIAREAVRAFNEFEKNAVGDDNYSHSVVMRAQICSTVLNDHKAAAEALAKLLGMPDAKMTSEQRRNATMALMRSYREIGAWEQNAKVFERFMREADSAEHREESVMIYVVGIVSQMYNRIQAADEKGGTEVGDADIEGMVDQVTKYLPYLPATSMFRHDVRLNGALFRAGDICVKRGLYNHASFFYNQVLTPSEIKVFYDARIAHEERAARLLVESLPKGKGMDVEKNPRVIEARARIEQHKAISGALAKVIDSKDDYAPYLGLRKAECWRYTNRWYEGIYAFLGLSEKYKNLDVEDFNAQAFYVQAIDIAYGSKLDNLARAKKLCNDYLASTWPKGLLYEEGVTVTLMNIHRDLADRKAFADSAAKFIEKYPTNANTVTETLFYLGEMYARGGEADTLLRQFTHFGEVFEKAGNRATYDDVLSYWTSIAILVKQPDQEGIGKAMAGFQRIIDNNKDKTGGRSPYWGDAHYRKAVCIYTKGELEEAEKLFTEFLNDKSLSEVGEGKAAPQVPEVHLYLGDIYNAYSGSESKPDKKKEQVELALTHYRKCLELARTMDTVSSVVKGNAVEQIGEILLANKRMDEYISFLQASIGEVSPGSDVSVSIFKLGEGMDRAGKFDQMFAIYLDGIKKHGNKADALGVDQILDAYAAAYNRYDDLIRVNIDFMNRMISSPTSREAFFAQGEEGSRLRNAEFAGSPGLDRDFRIKLQRDPQSLKLFSQDTNAIRTAFKKYTDMQERMPQQNAIKEYQALQKKAVENGDRTLELRLARAIDVAGEKDFVPPPIIQTDLDISSPAMLVWIHSRNKGKPIGRQALDKILEKFPDSDEAILAYIGLGSELEITGDLKGALAKYEAAIENYPGSSYVSEARMSKGEVLGKLNRYDEAIQVFRQLLSSKEARKVRVQTEYRLGQLYMAKQDFKMAAATFQRAYLGNPAAEPWSARCYLGAVRAYEAAGDMKAAKKVVEQFKKNPIANRNSAVYEELRTRMTNP